MQQTARRWPFQRQAAEYKRARREPDVLLFAFTVVSNHLDSLNLANTSSGNDKIGRLRSKQVTGARHTTWDALLSKSRFPELLEV
jgi:hypothetical protein